MSRGQAVRSLTEKASCFVDKSVPHVHKARVLSGWSMGTTIGQNDHGQVCPIALPRNQPGHESYILSLNPDQNLIANEGMRYCWRCTQGAVWYDKTIPTNTETYVDGLVQDCSNSNAFAMELLQSSSKPSISCKRGYIYIYMLYGITPIYAFVATPCAFNIPVAVMRNGVTNRRQHDCFFNISFRHRGKKILWLVVTGSLRWESNGHSWPSDSHHNGPVTQSRGIQ